METGEYVADASKLLRIERIAVIGYNPTGLALVEASVLAGLRTTLIRTTRGSVDDAKRRVAASLEQKRQDGRISRDCMYRALVRLRCAADISAASTADLVLEMTDFPVPPRQTVLRLAERATGGRAILATCASPLIVRPLGSRLDVQENFLGMHFLHPAVLAGLCEVSPTDRTQPTVVLAAMQWACMVGRLPVLVKGSWPRGFVAARAAEAKRANEPLPQGEEAVAAFCVGH
jgi:3-hydroxyacyl-CoA dehydrogenase